MGFKGGGGCVRLFVAGDTWSPGSVGRTSGRPLLWLKGLSFRLVTKNLPVQVCLLAVYFKSQSMAFADFFFFFILYPETCQGEMHCRAHLISARTLACKNAGIDVPHLSSQASLGALGMCVQIGESVWSKCLFLGFYSFGAAKKVQTLAGKNEAGLAACETSWAHHEAGR